MAWRGLPTTSQARRDRAFRQNMLKRADFGEQYRTSLLPLNILKMFGIVQSQGD